MLRSQRRPPNFRTATAARRAQRRPPRGAASARRRRRPKLDSCSTSQTEDSRVRTHSDSETKCCNCAEITDVVRFLLRASLVVAKRGASRDGYEENQRDLAPPARLLAAGRHHTVSFPLLSEHMLICPKEGCT